MKQWQQESENNHNSQFRIARICSQARFPLVNEWISKLLYIMKIKYHVAINQNRILLAAAIWMG